MSYGPYTVGQIPYGGAYIVSTPILDKIGRDAHLEELKRQKAHDDNMKALDDDFAKNVSQIRDADVPELTQKYNDYKNLWKQYNKPNHTITPDEQLKLLRKKAEVVQHVSKSKKDLADTKLFQADLAKNPGNFSDGTDGTLNPYEFMAQRNKMPLSKMQFQIPNGIGGAPMNVDFSQPYKSLMYTGNNTDFSKIYKSAEGEEKQRGVPVTNKLPGGLQSEDVTYKARNSPQEYAVILNGAIKGSRGEKDFLSQHDYTDDEAANIVSQYQELQKTPEFKAAWGDGEIPQSMFSSKKGRAIALASMEHALSHPPVTVKSKPYNNTAAVMDRKLDEWKYKNRLTFGQSMAKIKANKGAGVDPDTGYLSDNVADEVGKPITVRMKNTTAPIERTVVFADDVDPNRLDIITGKDLSKKKIGVKPDAIKVVKPDGSVEVKMGYYVDPGTGDWEGADGQKISRERVKDDYIKQVSPTKFKMEIGTKAVEKKQTSTGKSKWDKYAVKQ